MKNTPKTALMALTLLAFGCAASPSSQRAAQGSAPGHDLPIPQELQDQIRKSCGIGRQLYVLDKVAAIGTDALVANLGDLKGKGLAGYLPLQEADEDGTPSASFLVAFFTAETPTRIAYEIHVAPDVKPTFEAFDPPKVPTPSFAALIRARQLAISAMPRPTQPINPLVVPAEVNGEQGILVYLLAGTEKPNVAVFGRHLRALVPVNGSNVTYMMPLSNTALEIPTRGPEGQKTEAIMVNHVVTDFPLETHVFTSLLIKLPIYVTTSRGVWRVDGDNIALVSDKVPKA